MESAAQNLKGDSKLPANHIQVQQAGLPLHEYSSVSSPPCAGHYALQCLTQLAKATPESSGTMSSTEESLSAVFNVIFFFYI